MRSREFPLTPSELALHSSHESLPKREVMEGLEGHGGCGAPLAMMLVVVESRGGNDVKTSDIMMSADESDRLVQTMASLSLTHTIYGVVHSDHHLRVYIHGSRNGDTNIDAETIDAMVGVLRRMDPRSACNGMEG